MEHHHAEVEGKPIDVFSVVNQSIYFKSPGVLQSIFFE
jgi:hypothetical protein